MNSDLAQRAPRHPLGVSKPRKRQWLVPIGLVVWSLVPIVAGAFRMTELVGGADITPANEKFFASPVPIVAHIVSVTVFVLLGAVQFVPSLRLGRRSWHRAAGRVLVPMGVIAAASGMWMTLFYTRADESGVAMIVVRLIFGAVMAATLIIGAVRIGQRRFADHGAWMTRAFAIALGAGTQVLTMAIWAVSGFADEALLAIPMAAGWVINLVVAEIVIRRRSTRRRSTRS